MLLNFNSTLNLDEIHNFFLRSFHDIHNFFPTIIFHIFQLRFLLLKSTLCIMNFWQNLHVLPQSFDILLFIYFIFLTWSFDEISVFFLWSFNKKFAFFYWPLDKICIFFSAIFCQNMHFYNNSFTKLIFFCDQLTKSIF